MCVFCTGKYDPNQTFGVDCHGCTALTTLPTMPKLTWLNCNGCTSLTILSDMPKLTQLYCRGCTSLTILSNLPQLIWLTCTGCTALMTLPRLVDLTVLDCDGCSGLIALPELPQLSALNFAGCSSLKDIAPFTASVRCFIGKYRYDGPAAGRMLLRMKKILRRKYLRLVVQRYLKSPAYREMAIKFYTEKQGRDRLRLSRWLDSLPS